MTLREHLEQIKEQRGRLTPNIVVDEARDPSHPLHHRFEWDDSVAGESWRREQARKLIREVEITYTNKDNEPTRVRAFYAVPDGSGLDYKSLEELRDDPISKELVLREMKRDWQDLRDRYREYSEFWQLVEEEVSSKA